MVKYKYDNDEDIDNEVADYSSYDESKTKTKKNKQTEQAQGENSFEDLLKNSQAVAKKIENDAASPRGAGIVSPRQIGEVYGIALPDENLDDDFEETPWVPPTVEKALEYRKNTIFRGGDARINAIDVVNAPDLGPGVTLYFQFALSMAFGLFFMGILAIPELVFNSYGSRMPSQNRDAFGFYQLTLGNIGYDPTSSTYSKDSMCKTSTYKHSNLTCLHVGSYELSLYDAASVITACEIVQIFCFFVCLMHLYRKAKSIDGKKQDTSISDFSIIVRNIHSDTKESDLIAHFSKLYQLTTVDFKNRPAFEGARTVQHPDNCHDPAVINSWVAECIVHKEIGRFIRTFKDQQHLMEKLYRCRALMKMYGENTPHKYGRNPKLFIRAENRMIKTGTEIDSLTEKSMKDRGLKIINAEDPEHQQRLNIYHNIQAKSNTGFIVFEYAESLARCLEDYRRYHRFPMSLFYPNHLKFKGKRIEVMKAPEPDQIIWENLEVSNRTKMFLRARTNIISIILIVICFVIILQASIYKAEFSGDIPDSSLCATEIPSLYYNTSSKYSISNEKLVRPSDATTAAEYDATCKTLIPNSFYAIYTNNGNFNKPIISYSFSACVNTTTNIENLCPIQEKKAHCPCVTTSNTQSCETVGCVNTNSGDKCTNFKAGAIGACYCYGQLSDILTSSGVVSSLNQIRSGTGPCKSFYYQYSLASGLTYASVVVTVSVNFILGRLLVTLAKQECHTSGDKEQGAVMSKTFFANYAIMCIIVLVAYGNIDGKPDILNTLHIFSGPYSDFSSPWFGDVGFYFVTTFIISSFTPLLSSCADYYVVKPFLQYYHHMKVELLTSRSIVMQHDLNVLQVGPVFDATVNTAILLTMIFFAMTYAPGLPILMPLVCATVVMYFRIDKVLLCRHYKKPPFLGSASILLVLDLLPYAAIIRLAFACWMLGNPDLLPDPVLSTLSGKEESTSYVKFLKSLQSSSGLPKSYQERIFRTNTFPLLILLIIIVGSKLMRIFWKQLPFYWIIKFGQCISCCGSRDSDGISTKNKRKKVTVVDGFTLMKLGDPLRQEMAPFTGDYYKYLKHRDEIPDTCYKMLMYNNLTKIGEMDIDEGWEVADMGDYVVKVKKWLETVQRTDGHVHRKGEQKRTFEVVADRRCASYNVERVPAYKVAITALREGTQSMMELNNKLRNPVKKKSLIDDYQDHKTKRSFEHSLHLNSQKHHNDIEDGKTSKSSDKDDSSKNGVKSKPFGALTVNPYEKNKIVIGTGFGKKTGKKVAIDWDVVDKVPPSKASKESKESKPSNGVGKGVVTKGSYGKVNQDEEEEDDEDDDDDDDDDADEEGEGEDGEEEDEDDEGDEDEEDEKDDDEDA